MQLYYFTNEKEILAVIERQSCLAHTCIRAYSNVGRTVIHKMCNDNLKSAVMEVCLCSDHHRSKEW